MNVREVTILVPTSMESFLETVTESRPDLSDEERLRLAITGIIDGLLLECAPQWVVEEFRILNGPLR